MSPVITAYADVPAESILLQAKQLKVSFGDKTVVHSINFHIAMGEKLALVGESGSGKTVTALSLLKLAQDAQVSGQALFRGPDGVVDLCSRSEHELQAIRGRDIAMIFQEPMTALNPLFTVGDQISEVIQLKQGLGRMDAAQAAIDLIAETGIQEPARRARAYPHQLSGGQRQRVMIAMALACQPRLLLADEPTTALDVTVRGQILELLNTLQRRRGMAVLLITHDLNLVRRFADRVAVMDGGRIVEQGPVAQVFNAPVHAYTRQLIDSQPVRNVQEIDADSPQGALTLQAQTLRVGYAVPLGGFKGWFKGGEFVALQGADFSLHAGQTLGVIGESGSGKSTLALACLGLVPFTGALQVVGQTWSRSGRHNQAMRRAVQVVFQDPFSSLSPRMTIEQIVEEGLRVHAPALGAAERRERVQAALDDVGLPLAKFPGLLQRYPHEFSGGQRQRIAIARALIIAPDLLVLDEPTSALDVTIQKQVLTLLQRLQRERGLSYLLITHDVAVIQAMAHSVLVLKDGCIVESGPVHSVLTAPSHAYTQELLAAHGKS